MATGLLGSGRPRRGSSSVLPWLNRGFCFQWLYTLLPELHHRPPHPCPGQGRFKGLGNLRGPLRDGGSLTH